MHVLPVVFIVEVLKEATCIHTNTYTITKYKTFLKHLVTTGSTVVGR